jgi:hypothetical protein
VRDLISFKEIEMTAISAGAIINRIRRVIVASAPLFENTRRGTRPTPHSKSRVRDHRGPRSKRGRTAPLGNFPGDENPNRLEAVTQNFGATRRNRSTAVLKRDPGAKNPVPPTVFRPTGPDPATDPRKNRGSSAISEKSFEKDKPCLHFSNPDDAAALRAPTKTSRR